MAPPYLSNLIFKIGLVIMVSLLSVDTIRVRRDEADLENQAWNSEKAEVTTPKEFIDESLKVHNNYRKLHHVPDLVLDTELSKISQAYANKLVESASETYDNNPDAGIDELGENLYYYRTNKAEKHPNATKIIGAWYDEVKDYDFENGEAVDDTKEVPNSLKKDPMYNMISVVSPFHQAEIPNPYLKIIYVNYFSLEHFTQIVWKETTHLGIAYATTPEANEDGYYVSFIVANYNPRANSGDPLVNVFPIDLPTPPDVSSVTTVTPLVTTVTPLMTPSSSELPGTPSTASSVPVPLQEGKKDCKGMSISLSPAISLVIGCIIFLAYI